ncbi:hypothetical protein BD289DRAFT_426489 [Coniella lustricola]|uniref:Uncharacterized protein n=1 Tax=Coniella lustricola TaxID=2025994 RepID=A0A2T3AG05_9PEZI|nr:hypothetical protein BD289DRAFT_426489 [Coniella lustricola]
MAHMPPPPLRQGSPLIPVCLLASSARSVGWPSWDSVTRAVRDTTRQCSLIETLGRGLCGFGSPWKDQETMRDHCFVPFLALFLSYFGFECLAWREQTKMHETKRNPAGGLVSGPNSDSKPPPLSDQSGSSLYAQALALPLAGLAVSDWLDWLDWLLFA